MRSNRDKLMSEARDFARARELSLLEQIRPATATGSAAEAGPAEPRPADDVVLDYNLLPRCLHAPQGEGHTPLTGYLAPIVFGEAGLSNWAFKQFNVLYENRFQGSILEFLPDLCTLTQSNEAIQKLLTAPDKLAPNSENGNRPLSTTPLMLFVIVGDLKSISLLLPCYSAKDLLHQTLRGNNVLHLAAMTNQPEVMFALQSRAEALGVWDELYEHKNKCGYAPHDILNLLIIGYDTIERFVDTYLGRGDVNINRSMMSDLQFSASAFRAHHRDPSIVVSDGYAASDQRFLAEVEADDLFRRVQRMRETKELARVKAVSLQVVQAGSAPGAGPATACPRVKNALEEFNGAFDKIFSFFAPTSQRDDVSHPTTTKSP